MRNLHFGRQVFIPLACAVFAFAAPESFGANDGPRFSVKAKDRLDKEKPVVTEDEQEKSSGSITTTTTTVEKSTCNVVVDVTNRGKQSGTCTLKWYLLAEHFKQGSAKVSVEETKVVHSFGQKEITLESGATVSEPVSASFELTLKDVDSGGESSSDGLTKNGDEYIGYAILIMNDGKIAAKKSNSGRWLSDEWIKKYKSFVPEGEKTVSGRKSRRYKGSRAKDL